MQRNTASKFGKFFCPPGTTSIAHDLYEINGFDVTELASFGDRMNPVSVAKVGTALVSPSASYFASARLKL